MAQQTAVESIIIDLDNECKARGMFVNWDMYLAMEKEQIIESVKYGDVRGKLETYMTAEEYYNETYGTHK